MKPSTARENLTDQIETLLPQTQCGQCGYPGCRPYAGALAAGSADINRCAPGGAELIADLGQLLGRAPKPLDASCGVTKAPAVALIDEAWCIGCTLCIQACPVDAIAGAANVMHTVIAAECTGCELCIAPCPVDCIQMVAVTRAVERDARSARAMHAKRRYLARQLRLANSRSRQHTKPPLRDAAATQDNRKQAAVARALARARARIKAAR